MYFSTYFCSSSWLKGFGNDELLFIVPPDELEHVYRFKAIMEDTHGWYIPIVAEIDASNTTKAKKKPIDNIEQLKEIIK